MELTDILIDLSNSKAALEVANHTIRRLNGKCMRKNLVIIGLAWLSMKACTMLEESERSARKQRSAHGTLRRVSLKSSGRRTCAATVRPASIKKKSDTDLVERRKSVAND